MNVLTIFHCCWPKWRGWGATAVGHALSHAWQLAGLSLGWVTVIWLTHILSQADQRLNHVEPWAEKRLHTLRGATPTLHPLDVSDDRLALVLQALSDDTAAEHL